MRSPLDVWTYGTRIATISEAPDGRLSLSWTAEAQDRWAAQVRILSAKLTIGVSPVPALVKAYLDGLLRLVTFSHLVGNTDMHAKNISFIRRADGSVTLSPAYDISMHLHHRRDNRRFALDVNGKFLVDEVTVDDVVAEGRSWGLPERRAIRVVNRVLSQVAEAFSAIDRSAHLGVRAEAWDVVERRIRDALT